MAQKRSICTEQRRIIRGMPEILKEDTVKLATLLNYYMIAENWARS